MFGRVQISTQALRECFARDIPVLWLSTGGWLNGFAVGQPTKYVELRSWQTAAHAQGGAGLAQHMIAGKILNSRTLLRRNTRGDSTGTIDSLKRLADQARHADNFGTLLGIEGTVARLYFAALPGMITSSGSSFAEEFSQLGRNRRPPRDPLNALLSFCYSMLTKDLVATTLGVGLDPYLGIYHRSRHGRPAFALDLAEEFRPLIADSVVIGLVNNGEITDKDFIRRAGAVALTVFMSRAAPCSAATNADWKRRSAIRCSATRSATAAYSTSKQGFSPRCSSAKSPNTSPWRRGDHMPRRRYLIAYDIADPRRLRQVCTLMEEHGERLQFSVFLCDLTIAERAELETSVTRVMKLAEDSIVEIDLGATDNPTSIRAIGRPRQLPHNGPWRASHFPDSGPNKVRSGMEDGQCRNGVGSFLPSFGTRR